MKRRRRVHRRKRRRTRGPCTRGATEIVRGSQCVREAKHELHGSQETEDSQETQSAAQSQGAKGRRHFRRLTNSPLAHAARDDSRSSSEKPLKWRISKFRNTRRASTELERPDSTTSPMRLMYRFLIFLLGRTTPNANPLPHLAPRSIPKRFGSRRHSQKSPIKRFVRLLIVSPKQWYGSWAICIRPRSSRPTVQRPGLLQNEAISSVPALCLHPRSRPLMLIT